MQPLHLLISTLESASTRVSRSTALKPLGYLLAICVAGALTAQGANAPAWLIIFFAVFVGIVVLAYLWAYLYFACKNPDALRSESFLIQKHVIEKGFGDSHTGLLPVAAATGTAGMLTIESPESSQQ